METEQLLRAARRDQEKHSSEVTVTVTSSELSQFLAQQVSRMAQVPPSSEEV